MLHTLLWSVNTVSGNFTTVATGVTLNNASDCQTNGLYWTPNPYPIPNLIPFIR